jgi:myo-inositol-1(or 4)-monophosphatase
VTVSSPKSFNTLLNLAHILADRSGEVILPQFRRALVVDNKANPGEFDPVTRADRKAEQVIGRLIAQHAPSHGVIGEEFGSKGAEARFRWVIDPIDGTRAFITGAPMWGTLIGLLDGEMPVLGLMDQPFTGERFWSGLRTSHTRRLNGRARRIRTRPCAGLGEAVLMTTSPDLFAKGAESEAFARVKRGARMTRFGGDCYSYCLLASGFIDLVIEAGLKAHDVVALIPIIERAGGRITTWDGRPAASGGRIVASGDPHLHELVLRLLTR